MLFSMSIKGLGGLVGRKKSDILAQCRIIPFFYLQEALNLAKEEKEANELKGAMAQAQKFFNVSIQNLGTTVEHKADC